MTIPHQDGYDRKPITVEGAPDTKGSPILPEEKPLAPQPGSQAEDSCRLRAHPRVPIHATIEVLFRETGAFLKSYMLNISQGGVFIKTPRPFSIDTPIQLKLQLPGSDESMMIQGRVVWSNPHGKSDAFPCGMGVQFTDMEPAHRQKVDTLVKRYHEEIKRTSFL